MTEKERKKDRGVGARRDKKDYTVKNEAKVTDKEEKKG